MCDSQDPHVPYQHEDLFSLNGIRVSVHSCKSEGNQDTLNRLKMSKVLFLYCFKCGP